MEKKQKIFTCSVSNASLMIGEGGGMAALEAAAPRPRPRPLPRDSVHAELPRPK